MENQKRLYDELVGDDFDDGLDDPNDIDGGAGDDEIQEFFPTTLQIEGRSTKKQKLDTWLKNAGAVGDPADGKPPIYLVAFLGELSETVSPVPTRPVRHCASPADFYRLGRSLLEAIITSLS